MKQDKFEQFLKEEGLKEIYDNKIVGWIVLIGLIILAVILFVIA